MAIGINHFRPPLAVANHFRLHKMTIRMNQFLLHKMTIRMNHFRPCSALLGPPGLRRPPRPAPSPPATAPTTTGDKFMDGIMSALNVSSHTDPSETSSGTSPPMGYTENNSPTYLSTGNPCLDFFFHVVPDTPSETNNTRLYAAWDHDPLTTLKLICNLRGVRGTGKSDREGFYASAFWLHSNHPKTFACNVSSFASFGYFKDLLEMLYRLLEGVDIRTVQRTARHEKRNEYFRNRYMNRAAKRGSAGSEPDLPTDTNGTKGESEQQQQLESSPVLPSEVSVLDRAEKERIEKMKASAIRHEKYISMARKVIARYTHDPEYRFLHERVSDLFAQHLVADLGFLKANDTYKISLAAKWCPSISSSYDRSILLCESIAKKIFPRAAYKEYEGLKEQAYVSSVRNRLRKEVLVPLRKALELPEVYMCAKQWGSLPYNRVASVAMKFYRDKFVKHDGERFEAYLEKVKSGKAKIAAGALLPHEIIASLDTDGDGGQVSELQWQRIVDDLLKKGTLKNCLPVCDVSGSMGGRPLDVCVALGLLVSEINEEPWKGKVITFSQEPQMHVVKGDTLREKADSIKGMHWEMNTDFQKVFDLILQVAVNGKLSEDEVIKRVIVFSDMEFDEACVDGTNWETDYQVIERKFKEKGYGTAVPEIVFWNLRESRATPVPSNQKGVALVSGFSKNLLTMFLEDNADAMTPEAVMEAAISGEEYNSLVVLD